MTKEDIYLFSEGKLYMAYKNFGAHAKRQSTDFVVWAPNVKSVAVTGEFNNWDENGFSLSRKPNSDIWAAKYPDNLEGKSYKYLITTKSGEKLWKADPFATFSEVRPNTASIVHSINYTWKDSKWIKKREKENHFDKPKNIYEIHLGSWKRKPLQENASDWEKDNNFLNYREIADSLIPYLNDMGYNYLELMPVMEHPFDGSWGYQITGYYSASSRYGKPEDLMYLIDKAHQKGIGVILDWVPGHFCRDAHGLANFNGEYLYENEIHPNWGTGKFDFKRGEVRSFLLSNAIYWLNEFHADGLRVDGVSSMLYLNFGVDDEKKKKYNKHGEEGNLEAIEFFKNLSEVVATYSKGCFTVAEESTAWPLVTYPPKDGGLGFHYKWNMGWMNDTLSYFSCDFPYRNGSHDKLTFPMMYAFSENYILPFSHDEVVHGKCSLLSKQPGDQWRKFAGKRVMALYQMTQPGGKLNFMGSEFAPYIEWRYYEELEWFLPENYEPHTQHMRFTSELNHFYLKENTLWDQDKNWNGFSWIDANNTEQNILSYFRTAYDGRHHAIVVLNLGVENYQSFRIGVPKPGTYHEIFSTDKAEYGGNNVLNDSPIKAQKIPYQGMLYSIEIKLPSLSGVVLKVNKKEVKHK